jgi:hypothetical protein
MCTHECRASLDLPIWRPQVAHSSHSPYIFGASLLMYASKVRFSTAPHVKSHGSTPSLMSSFSLASVLVFFAFVVEAIGAASRHRLGSAFTFSKTRTKVGVIACAVERRPPCHQNGQSPTICSRATSADIPLIVPMIGPCTAEETVKACSGG